MSEVTVYTAQNGHLIWFDHPFSGFADGDDVISIETNNDTVDMVIGMKGDGHMSVSTDTSGTIKVRMLQGSRTNAFLSTKQQATRGGGVASGLMVYYEVGSDSKFTATPAILAGMAPFSRGAGQSVVEWTFVSPDVEIFHGQGEQI